MGSRQDEQDLFPQQRLEVKSAGNQKKAGKTQQVKQQLCSQNFCYLAWGSITGGIDLIVIGGRIGEKIRQMF